MAQFRAHGNFFTKRINGRTLGEGDPEFKSQRCWFVAKPMENGVSVVVETLRSGEPLVSGDLSKGGEDFVVQYRCDVKEGSAGLRYFLVSTDDNIHSVALVTTEDTKALLEQFDDWAKKGLIDVIEREYSENGTILPAGQRPLKEWPSNL